MKTWLLGAMLACAPLLAQADRLPVPADAPPAFKQECGSCHLAFPPALLAADDWRKVMGRLDRHYGDNASLDEAVRQQIEAFLVRHAGSARRLGATEGDPPRLTGTRWFRREHDEVPAAVWKDPAVKSAANCGACHSRAEAGSFSEREITLPGGRRRERN
jgi:hypothetical protein